MQRSPPEEERQFVRRLHEVYRQRSVAAVVADFAERCVLHRIDRVRRKRRERIVQQSALAFEIAFAQPEDLGERAVADAAARLDGERRRVVHDVADRLDSLIPHLPVGFRGCGEPLLLVETVAHTAHCRCECGISAAARYGTFQIRQFEMGVGIDERRREYAGVELHSRLRIEVVAVTFDGDDFAGGGIDRYERSAIKPLWSQQVVRGYPSQCGGTHRRRFLYRHNARTANRQPLRERA